MQKYFLSLSLALLSGGVSATEACLNVSGTYQAPGFMAVKLEQTNCQSIRYSAYRADEIDSHGTITKIADVSLTPFTIDIEPAQNTLVWLPPQPEFLHAQRNVKCTTSSILFSLDGAGNFLGKNLYTCVDGFQGSEDWVYYRLKTL